MTATLLWLRQDLRLADQPAENLIVLRAMRHEQVFVNGMELDHRLPCHAALQKILIPAITKHPLDEILPERSIAQPSFLLHRNQRELLDKSPREEAGAAVTGHPLFRIDSDSFHTATRRAPLEHITG